MKKLHRSLGILFTLLVPIWVLTSPLFLQKLDPEYELSLRQSGETHLYLRSEGSWIVSSENLEVYDQILESQNNHYIIQNDFNAYNREGTLDFNASSKYAIDPRTRENLSGLADQDREGYFMLPHFPKKTEYLMHSPLVLERAATLNYVEKINYAGESLLKYEYKIENVDKSEFFVLAELEEDQAIIGDHSGFILVEPVSGYIVYFSHGGENNVVDTATGEVLYPYEEWFNVTNEDSAKMNLNRALKKRSQINNWRFFPIVLLGFLALINFYLFWSSRNKKWLQYLEGKNEVALKASMFTLLVSSFVVSGWILDIEILKTVLPGFVSMKFTTALSFLFSGLLMFMLSSKDKNDMEEMLSIMCSCFIILLMGTLLFSAISGASVSIENLIFPENEGAPFTVSPGRPSYGTMFAFLLISVLGLLEVLARGAYSRLKLLIGALVLITSLLAFIGYTLNQPQLYFAVDGLSTAMAIHTATLFGVLGIGILDLFNKKSAKK